VKAEQIDCNLDPANQTAVYHPNPAAARQADYKS